MIYIKSTFDIELIKQAARIWKQVRTMLIASCKAGTSLITLDAKADQLIRKLGGTCSFYQYNGFPGHICISVNQALIHGIPDNYIIQPNDLVTFDVGVTYQNHVCDAAYTVLVKPGTNLAANEIDRVTYEALMESIKEIKPGNYTGDISHRIYQVAKTHGYEVIKDFGGHGCGNKVHEDPMILNYGEPGSGVKLVKGMVLCIEPMLMTKSDQYFIDKNNHWTVCSKDHQLTCHWEHMVLVTESGCEILTDEKEN